jgi:predicted DNA-binding WGR domain protein
VDDASTTTDEVVASLTNLVGEGMASGPSLSLAGSIGETELTSPLDSTSRSVQTEPAPSSPLSPSRLPSAETGKRHLEFSDGKSSKFWEITLSGNSHTVRFGRVGRDGQEMSKSFSTPQQARTDFERLIRQKLAKGYRDGITETST